MAKDEAICPRRILKRRHSPVEALVPATLDPKIVLIYHGRTRSLLIHFGRPLYLFSVIAIGGARSPSNAYNSRVIPSGCCQEVLP
jgi:hypothetical protein